MSTTTEIATTEKAAVARSQAAQRLQQDLRLSLGQNQSLPDMLMTAPLAINLLGQIKLLAFSDHALRIRLKEPKDGFQVLQRTSLSGSMTQVVDLSSDAFDTAEKNLRALRLQTNVMFGRTGHVQTILTCLRDTTMAQKDLLASMGKFEQDMEKCAEWAQDIEKRFDKLVKCACEINYAMADEITTAAEEEDKIKLEAMKAEAAKKRQNEALDELRARSEAAKSEFQEAKDQYQKTAKKGEFSALAASAAIGLGSSITGVVNATISIFKDTPKVAIEAVKAAGRLGSFGPYYPDPAAAQSTADSSGSQDGPDVGRQVASPGIDPALLAAEQIETQLLNLNELLKCSSAATSEKFEDFGHRLRRLKEEVGDFQSKHAMEARAILDDALDITIEMSANGQSTNSAKGSADWNKTVSRLSKSMKAPMSRATRLRSFAASQPGQGFGSSLDTAVFNVAPGDSTYAKVLHQRHQKLLITRSAMNDARHNAERTADMQLEAQAQIIEIARAMRELEQRQATLEDTKKILRKSIDVMVAMQDQVRQMTGFFNALAGIISIVCKGHAEQYLQTIKAGISNHGDRITLAYSEQQLQIIRETLFTLRGHFGFVVHSADMYQEISTAYINPCIRMAANLPLSASPAEQENAKRQLQEMTDLSSQDIQKLARKEMEKYKKELNNRVSEIEGQIAAIGLPAPEDDYENLKAIQDGVKASTEQIAEDIQEKRGLYEEIIDDL